MANSKLYSRLIKLIDSHLVQEPHADEPDDVRVGLKSIQRILKAHVENTEDRSTEWGVTHVRFDDNGTLTHLRCKRRFEQGRWPTAGSTNAETVELDMHYENGHSDFDIDTVLEMLAKDPPDVFWTLSESGKKGAEVVASIRTRSNKTPKDNLGNLPAIPAD